MPPDDIPTPFGPQSLTEAVQLDLLERALSIILDYVPGETVWIEECRTHLETQYG